MSWTKGTDPCSITDGEQPDEYDGSDTEVSSSWLCLQLGQAANHIAEHRSFDQQELIKLLKDAYDYIDRHPN